MATWNAIQWPVEQMRKWYEKHGFSVTEIAAILGRSPKLVWKVCKKHRFQMRRIGPPCGAKNKSWRGGRIRDKSGYVLVHVPDHPNANSSGYVREHRLVAEKVIGRLLASTEVVHHKDGNRENNAPSNLVVFETNAAHLAATIKGQISKWTDEGRRAIALANKAKGGNRQMRPIDWPDDATLRKWHVEERKSLAAIATILKCGLKRVSDRMHYRGIPVRQRRSATLLVPRRHVVPTPSILTRQEFDDLRSRGIRVHSTKQRDRRRPLPSQTGRSPERSTSADHSTTA